MIASRMAIGSIITRALLAFVLVAYVHACDKARTWKARR